VRVRIERLDAGDQARVEDDPHEDDHLMRSRMSEFCVKDDGRLLGVTRQDLLTYVRNRLALTT
jgi:hypothetical protein